MGRINGSIVTANTCDGAYPLPVPHTTKGQKRDKEGEQLNVEFEPHTQ